MRIPLIIIFLACISSFPYSSEPSTVKTPNINVEKPSDSAVTPQNKSNNSNSVAQLPKSGIPNILRDSYNIQSSHNRKNGSDEGTEFFCLFGLKFKITDFAMALFTLILVAFTIGLFKMAKRQNESLERVERAYIFPESINIDGPIGGSQDVHWEAKITFRNTGKTPAIIKMIRGYHQFIQRGENIKSLLDHPYAGNKISDGLILSAGNTYKLIIEIKNNWIDTIQGDSISHCIGLIEYKDVFNKEHRTGYDWQFLTHINEYIVSPNDKLNYYT